MQAQLSYHCVYTGISCIPCARQRSSGGAVGDVTALSRRSYFASSAYLKSILTKTAIIITDVERSVGLAYLQRMYSMQIIVSKPRQYYT